MSDYSVLALKDWKLESGAVLPEAKLAYKTYGALNPEKSNAILLCSYIAGTHEGYEPLIEKGRCFDPTRYFVVATNMFANGLSSSPSNTPPPFSGPDFPAISIRDNVAAQFHLVTQEFGIERLALVAGYSMGAQQTFQWAVSHPEHMERIAPWCGHARTTAHTWAFLDGMASVPPLDPAWQGGRYLDPPLAALRTLAHVYAGWGFSQAWYREERFKELGHATAQAFIVDALEVRFQQRDINNYLSQVKTWQTHNVGDTPGFDGDHEKALASIRAKALVMPCRTDLYFPPEDSALEVACMPNATLRPIESVWGHYAGMGVNPADVDFIDKAIAELLE